MPILNVDRAKAAIVRKRSMPSGFAGVENELLREPKAWMLFGETKASLGKRITETRNA